jgi:hypothetical protein
MRTSCIELNSYVPVKIKPPGDSLPINTIRHLLTALPVTERTKAAPLVDALNTYHIHALRQEQLTNHGNLWISDCRTLLNSLLGKDKNLSAHWAILSITDFLIVHSLRGGAVIFPKKSFKAAQG